VVGPGYHIALSREHAKRVFGSKDDPSLRSLIEELKNDKSLKANSQVLDCKRYWDAIHRCLTEGTLDPEGGEFPLNHVILGGKKLHQGDDYIAVVVRPDMVTFIAEELHSLKEPDFRQRFFALEGKDYDQPINEKEYSYVWHMVQEVRTFFEYCDEERFALLFVGFFKE
jgi:hypothetical protein